MTFARELIALHPLVAVREAMQAASKYLQVAFPEKAAAFEIPSCQAPAFGGAAPERAAADIPSPGEPAADASFGPSGDGQGSFLCGPWLALSVHDEVSCVPEQCWHTPLVEDMALLDPGSYTSAAEWLAAQVPLWLGGTPDTWEERWGLEPGALTGEQTGLGLPLCHARPGDGGWPDDGDPDQSGRIMPDGLRRDALGCAACRNRQCPDGDAWAAWRGCFAASLGFSAEGVVPPAERCAPDGHSRASSGGIRPDEAVATEKSA